MFREPPGRVDQLHKDQKPQQDETQLNKEQRQLIEELLPINQKPHECHACGRTDNLYDWNFGLGKKISTKRAWGGTAWSLAISAITVPLIGAGGVQLPGKKTRLRVLRLRLVLCDSCRQQRLDYSVHPWWAMANRLGYSEFLNAEQLARLETVR
jgi:hypothetical protein